MNKKIHRESCTARLHTQNSEDEHLDGEDGMTPIQRTAYERYKLDWLMTHGFTLLDLMREINNYAKEVCDDAETRDIITLFHGWEDECGFGSRIYACADEFLDSEYLMKRYIKKLLSKEEYALYLEDIKTI